jgi:uncharacterized protein YacL
MCYIISLHAVVSTLCVVILIYFVSYFNFLYNYFLKFIVYKIHSEMVKSEMMILTGREKTDMIDTDMIID